MTLTTLAEPKSSSRSNDIVDVVAIHGLYEDAIATWTDPISRTLWLRDLLPEKVPDVRVLNYSYRVGALVTLGDETTDSIHTHAINLVAELYADRQLDDASERPIIFICHGFGGLLAKRALAYSHSRRNKAVEHLCSIYTSTYGILFMATPHNGINADTQLSPQKDHMPGVSHFVRKLLKGSEILNEINDQFAPLMKQFCVYNFWEELETQDGDHIARVVDQDSAAPAWDNVEKCGILATHSGMTKFSSHSDRAYRPVLEALTRYARRAHALVQARWDNDEDLLARERQREADELLQPRNRQRNPSDVRPHNFNRWCLVPRSPSTYFTGRQKHAEDVKEMLGSIRIYDDQTRNKVVVLYGMGGSGKTQFCLKYVEENKHRYWGVFWVDASSEENIETGFSSIGSQAGRGATLAAGKHWLSQCAEPWLLIIDNADDYDMDLPAYLPAGGNGHVLVTTRNPKAVEYATAGHLRFHGMDPDEAIQFLLKAAYPDTHTEAQPSSPSRRRYYAKGITVELGYLPLALAHAGATIRRNIYTIDKYLQYYLVHRRTLMSHQRVKSADETDIISTWEIPFQRIVKHGSIEHRDAVDLMHIFAFLHFESIPETIFQRSWTDPEKSDPRSIELPDILQSVWNEEAQARFRRAIGILCDYSIVDYEPAKASCAMHPVIHSWARDRMPEEEQKQWLRCTMAVLAQCISPHLEASGRRFRSILLPHINSCLQALHYLYSSPPKTLIIATEYERFSWVYAEQCLWKTARDLQKKAVDIRKKLLGRRHKDTILAQRGLGHTQWNLFDIRSAIDTHLEVRSALWWHRPSITEWTVWPPWFPSHVPYCIALSDLTLTLWLAGVRDWSKWTGERAVNGLLKRLGPEDPITLNAMFNLARTYLHLGEHEKSRELLVWVLRLQKRFFGWKHPDTLMTRNELGINLCASKRHLRVAQRLVENVLQARREILGHEHAYTLWSVNDVSKVYAEVGRVDEAIRMLEDALPVVQRTLSEDHVGMFMTKSNLGRAYFAAGKFKEAEVTVRSVINKIQRDHPDWIHNMYGYTHILFKLGAIEQAERNCDDMLAMIAKTKNLALDNPRTVAIADLLAQIYEQQGRQKDIVVLKKKYPGIGVTKSEDRFDPYAIRKGSDTSINVIKHEAATPRRPDRARGPLKHDSDHGLTDRTSGTRKERLHREPFPKLVPRHTF
ncbi:TPR-like protein [Lophiostoma macrostomum CBS 122681]|uniref:TPR-like protein n=1 Tax=Lophiostoma macrostomum CBS 122681 TaxID=1314788 RepID=A0A6A6SKQ1_9PLEO|nr:TPR-like protein [Lophiostoma macrostomum CBS 122681]